MWKKCSPSKTYESIISEGRVPESADNKNVKTKETDYNQQFLHLEHAYDLESDSSFDLGQDISISLRLSSSLVKWR